LSLLPPYLLTYLPSFLPLYRTSFLPSLRLTTEAAEQLFKKSRDRVYVTKVLTDLTHDDLRKSTSTSTSSSICSVGSNAKNAIDLECEEGSLKNGEPSEVPNSINEQNVLSSDSRMTMKRGREETIVIDNDVVIRREGKENANENEKEIDMNKESEKKKKTERDKENDMRIKTESKIDDKNGSNRVDDNESEKKRVELKTKEAQELTAAVRLSLGLSHTIQPVSKMCMCV
jgi:hypothetical protein